MAVITGGVVGAGLITMGICCGVACCSLATNSVCDIFARRIAAEIHPDLTVDQARAVRTALQVIEAVDGGRLDGIEVAQVVNRALGQGTPLETTETTETRVGSPELMGDEIV